MLRDRALKPLNDGSRNGRLDQENWGSGKPTRPNNNQRRAADVSSDEEDSPYAARKAVLLERRRQVAADDALIRKMAIFVEDDASDDDDAAAYQQRVTASPVKKRTNTKITFKPSSSPDLAAELASAHQEAASAAELLAASEAAVETLKAQIRSSDAEIATLVDRLRDAEAEQGSLKEQLQTDTAAVFQHREAELRAQLETSETGSTAAGAAFDATVVQQAALQKRAAAAEEESSRLRRQLDERGSVEGSELYARAELYERQVAVLQAKSERVEAERSALLAANSDLQDRLRRLKSELEKGATGGQYEQLLQADISRLTGELKKSRAAGAAARQELQQREEGLRAEVASLKVELRQSEAALKNDVLDLEVELQQREVEISRLQRDLEQTRAALRAAELLNKDVAHQAQHELRAARREKEAAAAAADAAICETEGLRNELSTLETAATAALRAREKELARISEREEQTRAETDSLRARLEAAAAGLKSAEAELEELKGSVSVDNEIRSREYAVLMGELEGESQVLKESTATAQRDAALKASTTAKSALADVEQRLAVAEAAQAEKSDECVALRERLAAAEMSAQATVAAQAAESRVAGAHADCTAAQRQLKSPEESTQAQSRLTLGSSAAAQVAGEAPMSHLGGAVRKRSFAAEDLEACLPAVRLRHGYKKSLPQWAGAVGAGLKSRQRTLMLLLTVYVLTLHALLYTGVIGSTLQR